MHPHQGVSSHEKRFAHPERNIAFFGIEPGMKVADFGAGSGVYIHLISDALLKSGTVYAIDIQKDLLRRIKNEADKRGASNVEIIWGDLEEEEGSKLSQHIDLVLISNLLFQLNDPRAVMREAERVLKPGGRVIIIDWSDSFSHMGPHPDAVVTKDAAYALARGTQLTFVKEFNAGAHHYGLIFRKSPEHGHRA